MHVQSVSDLQILTDKAYLYCDYDTKKTHIGSFVDMQQSLKSPYKPSG